MAIDATSAVGAAKTATTSSKKKDDTDPAAIQERFMRLLVAQLKNQDPMEPMDNAQVTSQMAQLNTVTGIQNLNSTMQGMANSFAANQTVQATGMLGRTILTEGNTVNLANGVAKGAVELKGTADAVTLQVLDAAGKVIRSADLGAQKKGVFEFDWDGKNDAGDTMKPGNYHFQVLASSAGADVELTTLNKYLVQGVRNGGTDGSKLLTNAGTEVSIADIKQIF